MRSSKLRSVGASSRATALGAAEKKRLTPLYGLIPDGPGEVVPDVPVLGDQRRSAELGLPDEESVERISRPIQGKGDLHHAGKGEVANFQPDLTPKVLEDHLRRLSGPPYLEEILKLKLDNRRDQQIGAVEELPDPRGKEV